MNSTQIKLESLSVYEAIKHVVESKGTTCPCAYVFPAEGEPTLLVYEMESTKEEEDFYDKLRGVARLMKLDAVALIMIYNVILPTQGDMPGKLFSVSIYEPGKPTWTYGWTYMKVEDKVEWIEEFCSDTKVISAKVLDLW